MKILKKTLSLCPECLRVIKADVVNMNGTVKLKKRCQYHGYSESRHIWDTERIYLRMSGLIRDLPQEGEGLVLNLTNRCNLTCPFCFSLANDIAYPDLKIEQIKKLTERHKSDIIYLSGGEPTIYKNLFKVIRFLKRKKRKVLLFTNGLKLADKNFVRQLKTAGVDFVILQFDTLNDAVYTPIRGESLVKIKLTALMNLKDLNLPVYLFVMLVKGKNTSEIKELLDLVSKNKEFIKIINFNPVWQLGRLNEHEDYTSSMILKSIEDQIGLTTEDFLDSTEFAYYFFDILEKLKGKHKNVHPRCELRCYIMFIKDRLVPITDILDLRKINKILRIIVKNGDSKTRTIFLSLRFLPFLFLLLNRYFITRRYFRKLITTIVINLIKNPFPLFSMMHVSPFRSIIVGTFQTADNIDFDMQKTCNLYSHFPDSDFILPACARQIILNKKNCNQKDTLDLDELSVSIQKGLGF